MENWMIGARFIILFYCVLRYFRGSMENTALVVLFMLLYISAVTTACLLRKTSLKTLFRVLSVTILAVSSVMAYELFLLLMSADIYEIVSAYTDDWKALPVFAAVPAFFSIDTGVVLEYVMASLMCLLVFLLARKFIYSLGALQKANEDLRDRIDDLTARLSAGSEYEAQLRYLSQIEERNALAQKIHDEVGHTLAGSIIQLEAVGLIMEKDPAKAGEMVRNVTENLKEGMESIRSTLRAIKPAPEQLGINRLKLILEEFTLNNGIETEFSHEGRLDVITHMQWSIMTDNMREALTNSLKHSSASRVRVRIDVMNKVIKMEVRDNGKGETVVKKGMGLAGMEERTGAAGGKLIIDGSDGFSVITLLPVEN
ncbi:MAG TPA: histidine kinase, partial [Clostridiales bacterium]|nr:histidine kinase [Clostridiales bacterium]